MEKREKIIFSVSLLFLVLFIFSFFIFLSEYYEAPQLAPEYCGTCTEWKNDVCGGGDCFPHEMQRTRVCSDVEREDPIGPRFSPFPESCYIQCIYTPKCNVLPTFSGDPSPFDGETGLEIRDILLSWGASDSDGDNLTFDVYFDNSLVAENITETNYLVSDILDYNTTYSWSVIVKDNFSEVNGPNWNFTTRANFPPIVDLVYPLDASEDLPLSFNLSWSASDLDGDNLTFDVYIGESPSLFATVFYSFFEVDLDYGTTYFWRIGVNDSFNYVLSDLFSFTIIEETIEEELPEVEPSVSYPAPRVVEPEAEEEYPLFDIRVVLDGGMRVLPGSDVDAMIILYNFGTLRPVDVFLKCALEDEDAQEYDLFEETLAVSVQTSIIRSLTIPNDAPSGRYFYSCSMVYGEGETVYSKDLFSVVNIEEETVGFDYTNVLNFAAFLLILLIILLFFKYRKKK